VETKLGRSFSITSNTGRLSVLDIGNHTADSRSSVINSYTQLNMLLTRWVLTAAMLVAEASLVASSTLSHIPLPRRREDFNKLMQRASKHYGGDLERRSPQQSSTNGDLSLSTPAVERNVSTQAACMSSMQGLSNVTNEAGFAACYNILDWQENISGMFQADLRLYQASAATGQFADVPMSAITVQLNYPNSTQFSILTNSKRSLASLQRRQDQSGPTEIQQYSLVGNFKIQLDTKKLNSTELMSLLIPQISLQANTNGTAITADISPADTAYFVAGQFKDEATPQFVAQAASPAMAVAAIAASKGFVLPGTTFGIFPVGLIVTCSWTVLFLVAFGLGTIGRIRHRDIFRKRLAANTRLGKK